MDDYIYIYTHTSTCTFYNKKQEKHDEGNSSQKLIIIDNTLSKKTTQHLDLVI